MAWAARVSRPDANGRSCAPIPAPRLMTINGDEGEPGTFKDRYYLEREPHCMFEGALIAAWAVEAERIYLYMRDEYPAVLAHPGARDRGAGRSRSDRGPDRASPRRRSLYLRRRVGDDRVDRRQARLSAQPAALYCRGRFVRPADPQSKRRDALLGAGDPGKGRQMVCRPGRQWRPKACAPGRCRGG